MYFQSNQDNSYLKRIISTNCCIHTVVPHDDGPRQARNMQRLTKYAKNKLCNKLVLLYTTVSRRTVSKTSKKILAVTSNRPNKLPSKSLPIRDSAVILPLTLRNLGCWHGRTIRFKNRNECLSTFRFFLSSNSQQSISVKTEGISITPQNLVHPPHSRPPPLVTK